MRGYAAVVSAILCLCWAPGLRAENDGPALAQGLAKQALDHVERAEQTDDAARKRSEYSAALELAHRVLAVDDQNADAHFVVFAAEGRLMLMNGVSVNPVTLYRASRELERTLEIDPNHARALTAKGGLYRQLPWALGGSLTKAEDLLTQAIELNPTSVSARIELAATYRDMGQPEKGVPLLERAVLLASLQGRNREIAEAEALIREIRDAN